VITIIFVDGFRGVKVQNSFKECPTRLGTRTVESGNEKGWKCFWFLLVSACVLAREKAESKIIEHGFVCLDLWSCTFTSCHS